MKDSNHIMIRAGFKGVQTVPMNSKVVGPTSRKEGHQWKVKKDIVSKSAEPPLSAVNTTFAAHRRRLQDGAHSNQSISCGHGMLSSTPAGRMPGHYTAYYAA